MIADHDTVVSYEKGDQTFAGVYRDRETGVLVVLFADDVDEHARLLTPRLVDPAQVRFARTDRTQVEVDAADARIGAVLVNPRLVPDVLTVGVQIVDQGVGKVVILGVSVGDTPVVV